MKISKRLKNAYTAFKSAPEHNALSSKDLDFLDSIGVDISNKNEMSSATYYACIKMLSESIGKLPLKLYQKTDSGIVQAPLTDTSRLLSIKPNSYMNASTFWSTMEQTCQHFGDAFAYIDSSFIRDGKYGGRYVVNGIYPMDYQCTSLLIDDAGIFKTNDKLFYQYTNPHTGETDIYRDNEVLHFRTWHSFNGITGEPVKRILRGVITGELAASEYQNNLYKNGLTASMALGYTSIFEDSEIDKLQKKYADKLTGPKAAGRVIPVPIGLTLTPLNMSLVDADFLNLKRYNALQIAACFGIKPSQLNDYSNSKYASSESENISFLVDALMYRLRMYEEEINAKILTPAELKDGYFYRFNEKALFRMSSLDQSTYLKNLVQGGIMTPNEARDKIELPHKDGADTLLVNGSYVPVEDAGAAYNK